MLLWCIVSVVAINHFVSSCGVLIACVVAIQHLCRSVYLPASIGVGAPDGTAGAIIQHSVAIVLGICTHT